MLEYANDEKAIFLAALEQASVQEREAYLRGACGGDVDLLKRVKVLLSVHEDSQGPLDAPSPGVGIAPTVDEPITERPGTVIGPYKLLSRSAKAALVSSSWPSSSIPSAARWLSRSSSPAWIPARLLPASRPSARPWP